MKNKKYTKEFKAQIVALYQSGKTPGDIVREYELSSHSLISTWVKQFETSGKFTVADNRSILEKELIELKKRNKQLEMENDIPKASSADNGTKIKLIRYNSEKYSISAMCKLLNIPRNSYYYESNREVRDETELEKLIIVSFKNSRNNYGTRKIKQEMKNLGHQVSRRRIGRIIRELGLISNYTKAHYKVKKAKCNEECVENIVNREFSERKEYDVAISDLTYVRVGGKWHYICLIVDLFNREIIGYSVGPHKDAALVLEAFRSIKVSLKKITIFHTDRGSEFKNEAIDTLLKTFEITRSLSAKGTPYDNEKEFVYQKQFNSLNELRILLADYVHWHNFIRLHGSIGYMPPEKYRLVSSF
ncbi:MAG: IS3 family transposase [Fusobacteria bacterium]|nr:IS3 family transposase [Fusobacteriota bacterium]